MSCKRILATSALTVFLAGCGDNQDTQASREAGGDLADGTQAFTEQAGEAKDKLAGLADSAADGAGEVGSAAGDQAAAIGDSVGEAAGDTGDAIGGFAESAGDQAGDLADAASDKMNAAGSSPSDRLQNAKDQVAGYTDGLGEKAESLKQDIQDGAGEAKDRLAAGMPGSAGDTDTGIGSAASDASESARDAVAGDGLEDTQENLAGLQDGDTGSADQFGQGGSAEETIDDAKQRLSGLTDQSEGSATPDSENLASEQSSSDSMADTAKQAAGAAVAGIGGDEASEAANTAEDSASELANRSSDLGSGDQAAFETPSSSLSSGGSDVLDTVTFEFNSHEVDADTSFKLDAVANNLQDKTDASVEIIGYTDSKGSSEYNEWLSQRRAEAVKDYLVSKGISPNNLSTKSSGAESPVADNTTEQGRGANRRVEIVLR